MREQININKIVGIKDGEVYILDYVFRDGFSGATGTVMSPLTKEQIAEYKKDDAYLKELWQDAAKCGHTELSFKEFAKEVKAEAKEEGKLFVGDDTSYREEFIELINKLPKDQKKLIKSMTNKTWECVGGGRCFSKGMKFDTLFDEKLLDLINEYEGE